MDPIRAEPDHRDGRLWIEGGQQRREILRVGRGEQHLRRPADAEPRQVGQGLIRDEPAAQARRPVPDGGGDVGEGGHGSWCHTEISTKDCTHEERIAEWAGLSSSPVPRPAP
jgi:hypothetical protein